MLVKIIEKKESPCLSWQEKKKEFQQKTQGFLSDPLIEFVVGGNFSTQPLGVNSKSLMNDGFMQ